MQHCDMARKSYLPELLIARTGREDLGAYLRELYIDRRLTDVEIAGLLGISRSAVNDLRQRHGIDRADRKAAIA